MTPSGRSLIVELLSTLKRGTMPVAALVEAGALFGIPGNTLRVALARLLATGEVARDERGRYRIGAGAEPVKRRVRSWRDFGRASRTWDGSWLAVHHGASPAERRRTDARGRERAFRFFGLRALAPGLSVRPNNLRGDVHAVRAELREFGLPASDLVAELRGLDDATDARARGLWNVAQLRASYRDDLRQLAESQQRLPALPTHAAMVESFLLGRRLIRDLVLDPLLPDAICPADDRDALVAAVRAYDRVGRTAWVEFLKRFDVPHIGAPLEHHRIAV